MVNDYITPTVNYAHNVTNEWETYNADNLAGKSLFIAGVEGVIAQYSKCGTGVDEDVMGPIVQGAIGGGRLGKYSSYF
jgi:hypothetical protein